MWQVDKGFLGSRSAGFVTLLMATLFVSVTVPTSATTSRPPSPTHNPPELRPAGHDPSDEKRITALAQRIASAATEAEADAFLNAEVELAGIELGRALLLETLKLRGSATSGERMLTLALRLARYADRPDMRAARGLAHRAVGLAYANLERWDLADTQLQAALAHFSRSKTVRQQDVILVLRDLASMYQRRRDLVRALYFYERTSTLARAANDLESVIHASNGAASIYLLQGDYDKAYSALERSTAAANGLNDNTQKLNTLSQLASAYLAQGRISKAAATFDTAYRTASASGSPGGANFLFQSALAQIKLGDLSAAYSRFRKVQAESATAADRRLYLYSVLNIAWIYKQHAEDKTAAKLYEQTITMADVEIANGPEAVRSGIISVRAEAVNRLAEMQAERGENQVAVQLYAQNLQALRSATSSTDQPGRAGSRPQGANAFLEIEIQTRLGELLGAQGNHAEALAHLNGALAQSERIGYDAGAIDTLLSMATHAARRGNPEEAFSYVDKAQLRVQKNGRLDQLLKLRTITASIQRKLNRPAAADLTFQEAVRISESLRTDITMPDQRASYFSSLFAPFDEYIDFLMERHEKEPDAGFDRKAFNVSERRRARALLDSLKVARVDIRHGVEPALLEEESRIRTQLNSAAREQFSLAGFSFRPIGDVDPILTPAVSPKVDITLLSAELARVETEIRKQSYRYAELMQPRPLRWGAIQTLIDEKTVVLNYTLGEKRSYLWLITQQSMDSYILPPRAEIEALVKTVYGQQSESPEDGEGDNAFTPAAEALSALLLEPAVRAIGDKRIVIVADGALQYLPFSSLPDPRTRATSKTSMLLANEIQFAPSASVVAVLRQEAERRPAPPRAVAIFADPVFSADDERFGDAVIAKPGKTRTFDGPITRSLFDLRVRSGRNATDTLEIPRLPFSGREAEAIFTNSPTATSLMAVDFDASREKIESVDLSQYGIVHFATHGILDSEHPELSGVVLSLFNRKGEPVNGFLRLNEIYNMRMNADLVVLSACQTALGKEVRGEGLIGLTRGFMYAGSPRVVASLWKVDDVATAELMKVFYQKLLKEGMRPPTALRAAKIEMMKQKRWASPYYWAAFELQGEWR
jgi:CHAT domain-containing protein/tetratricopeptide (TPR) repeat protein